MGTDRDATQAAFAPVARDITYEWMDGTTVHGLPRAFSRERHHWARRIFWAVVFTGSLGFYIYDISGLIADYLDYKTSVSVSVEFARSLEFPVVAVCNNNPFNATAFFGDVHGGANITDDYEALAVRYAIPFDAFVLRCQFNKRNCTSSDFAPLLNPRYGVCWEFNRRGDARVSGRPGVEHGLFMELRLNQDDYLPDLTQAGVRIAVNARTRPSLPELDGIALGPGVASFLSLSHTRVKKKGSPYSACDDGKATSTVNGLYSPASCYVVCRDTYIASTCGCRQDFSYAKAARRCVFAYSIDLAAGGASVPASADSVCYERAVAEYDSGAVACDCPGPCNNDLFAVTPSQMALPSEAYARALVAAHGGDPSNSTQTGEAYWRLSRDYLTVSIFYPELSFQFIEETPATSWESLLGSIGGNMGMFLGMSVLSATEVLEYCYWLATAFVSTRRARRREADSGDDKFAAAAGSTATVATIGGVHASDSVAMVPMHGNSVP